MTYELNCERMAGTRRLDGIVDRDFASHRDQLERLDRRRRAAARIASPERRAVELRACEVEAERLGQSMAVLTRVLRHVSSSGGDRQR